jgi:hypothetical protein
LNLSRATEDLGILVSAGIEETNPESMVIPFSVNLVPLFVDFISPCIFRCFSNVLTTPSPRDKIPDPSHYYVKDYPTYTTAFYPEIMVIQPRYIRPVFDTTPPPYSPESEKATKTITTYECILCNVSFQNEDELSTHISSQH